MSHRWSSISTQLKCPTILNPLEARLNKTCMLTDANLTSSSVDALSNAEQAPPTITALLQQTIDMRTQERVDIQSSPVSTNNDRYSSLDLTSTNSNEEISSSSGPPRSTSTSGEETLAGVRHYLEEPDADLLGQMADIECPTDLKKIVVAEIGKFMF